MVKNELFLLYSETTWIWFVLDPPPRARSDQPKSPEKDTTRRAKPFGEISQLRVSRGEIFGRQQLAGDHAAPRRDHLPGSVPAPHRPESYDDGRDGSRQLAHLRRSRARRQACRPGAGSAHQRRQLPQLLQPSLRERKVYI